MYQMASLGWVSAGASLLNETTQATIIVARTTTYVPRATVPSIAVASVFFVRIVEEPGRAGMSLIFG
jgi:hypothetical protein